MFAMIWKKSKEMFQDMGDHALIRFKRTFIYSRQTEYTCAMPRAQYPYLH